MVWSQKDSGANRAGIAQPAGRFARWLRRLGLTGVAVFFVKGLLWLVIPALFAHGLVRPSPPATKGAPVAVED